MNNSPHPNATVYRFVLAVCVLLCAVFISHTALAEKQTRCVLVQAHASTNIAKIYFTAPLKTQDNPFLTTDQVFVDEPIFAPEVGCRSVVLSLPKKQNTSNCGRHDSSNALHRTPKFPRILAAPIEVYFLWRNQEDSPPPASGMRDQVRYPIPPPFSA